VILAHCWDTVRQQKQCNSPVRVLRAAALTHALLKPVDAD
jgi:hypothetical protein